MPPCRPTAASPRCAPARTRCSPPGRPNWCGREGGAMAKTDTITKADNRPFAVRRYSPQDLRAALKRMYLIRRFEEGAEESYMRGLIHGTMHLCIGQEASAVATCMELTDADKITSTHRGHGHCIA